MKRRSKATKLPYDAVLLASFGAPEGEEDVLPFLRNVSAGRGIPDQRLEEVAGHYRALGGISPLTEQVRTLQGQLSATLHRRGLDVPVLAGHRNWHPYLADVLEQASADGYHRILALPTAAYSCYSSCRQYREDFAAALADRNLIDTVRVDRVRQYFDHPGFIQPLIENTVHALQQVADAGFGPDQVAVLFSTHSIPTEMAAASGPSGGAAIGAGQLTAGHTVRAGYTSPGAYVRQHLAVRQLIMSEVEAQLEWWPTHRLVFQSRSGPPSVPWLEPDIDDVITEQAELGTRAVVVVPIGFIFDHVEVIWDLDTVARKTAETHDLHFVRVPTPATDARFVAGLADLIEERLKPRRPRHALTGLGPMPDECAARCCLPRVIRPTVGGTDSAQDCQTGSFGLIASDDGPRPVAAS